MKDSGLVARISPAAARVLLIVFGVGLSAMTGEVALRVTYRDGGSRTLSGPGPRGFDHDTIDGELRGRRAAGPKTPGVPRVMVVGDSITYGLGIKDWKATWPELLAVSLERAGRPHEFAVHAVPGNDMPQLLDTMRGVVRQVQPDVLIYQWYVNDIEAVSHRPNVRQPWQRVPWHSSLQSWSYLYYVLDHRFSQVLSRPHVAYLDYLRNDFRAGSLEWTEFEREFHEFATLAQRAPRRIMMLYPQVPFRGAYPLQAIHDRMRALVGPHALGIPPIAWTRAAGRLTPQPDAPWGQVVRTQEGSAALHVETRDYLFLPGRVDVHVKVIGAPSQIDFALLELVDVASGTVAASAPLHVTDAASNQDVALSMVLPGDRARRLSVRIRSISPADWGLSDIAMQVDYAFEVLDLAHALNTFNTHASSFDAHPNERAHQVMADALYDRLTPDERRGGRE